MKTYIKTVNNHKYQIEEFESVLELTNANKTRKCKECWKHEDMNKHSYGYWEGVNSYQEAYDLLSNGWEQGTKRVANLADKVANTGVRTKTSFVNDIHGFVPNVPLAMRNVPNSMINMVRTQIKSKVINIVYDISASSKVSSDDMINAGINVVNTIINLEMSGYRCELKVLDSYCTDDSYDCCMVKIKSADQPFNLKKMMFPLAHSAMLRVVGFDWENKCPFADYKPSRGQPYYVRIKHGKGSADDLKNILGANTVYLNYDMTKQGSENIKTILTCKGK